MKKIIPFIFIVGILISCQLEEKTSTPSLEAGLWRVELELAADAGLPFHLEMSPSGSTYSVFILNGPEKLKMEDAVFKDDSIILKSPIFNSEFRGEIISPTEIRGLWHNYYRGPDYKVPFVAQQGDSARFPIKNASGPVSIDPVWETTFSPEDSSEDYPAYPAIGEFVQEGNLLFGTFLTETGDYRYLEGVVDGDEIKLSAFDGSHAFLFMAKRNADGQLDGTFLSGTHWQEPWIATPNPEASIREADAITYLKEGYDQLDFSFPDLNGEMVSFSDSRYKDKVVIVQIMGSWCPNCMDETKLFSKWYDQYKSEGLEVIALAFERGKDFEDAAKQVRRLKTHFGVNYEFLIASIDDDKEIASQKLPMLNEIISFPTSIFIDRDGTIRKIHTGFSGPGTGHHYTRFVEKYTRFLEEMLREGDEREVASVW